jgi:ABC-type multidrug transport system ATPase subunit/ABC-type multidrug transport system permease subunit
VPISVFRGREIMAMAAADMWRAGSRRSNSSGIWRGGDDVFSRSSRDRDEMDDEEALKWAALEKLPTYDRIRKGILHSVAGEHEEVDVAKIGFQDRRLLIDRLLKIADEDNEHFLLKLRSRIDKVGIEIPRIEVRYEHLNVDADVYVGSRALPTIPNFTLNMMEAFLSWLRIFPNRKKPLSILHDVSGIIKPCRMTLLLGPPSSGKTTLLLALAGKLDSELRVTGSVTYNGHRLDEFVPQRTSAYISQHDLHIGEMTVRETMDFSGRCQGVGTRYDMLVELSRREKQAGIKPDRDIDVFMKAVALEGQETSLVTDYILKILGLDICGDTIVGDEMRRGISGGQKKRVTTGEMLVGPARALFMDEISTGLDSSTTFQIVKCLRQTVHVLDGTTFISLLQPAPETYDLFDDIVLLSEGQIVYQGPREHVLEFFESMGFRCPERKGVADFLQEVTSRKDQQQYWALKDQPYIYVPVKEFAEAFQSFRVGLRLTEELSVPYDKSKSHPAALTTSRYGVNKKELFKACFWREWLLMRRNSFVYVFKTSQLTVLAFITMTLFLRTKMHHDTPDDGNIYMGAIFFGLVSCMFNGFAELSLTIQKLPVFYKQRDLLFFPSWAYSLPICVTRIPISFLEAGIWVFMTYYVIGFDPEVGRLFRQFLLLFCVHQMATSLFRFIASLGRNMIVANTFGAFALLVVLLLGGFLLSRHDIKSWWIWGYWVSPLMYGQNAISVNEFLGNSWNKPTKLSNETLGVYILTSRGIFPRGYWYWIGIAALLGYSVLFNICFTAALAYLKPLGKAQAVVSEEALQEKHANRTGETMGVELSSHPVSKGKSIAESASEARAGEIVRRSSVSSAGSLSDRLGATAAANSGKAKKGMVLPFEPLSIAFDDISYFVDMPAEMKEQGITETRLQLLRSVSGAFRPGVLTALVGVSGAGKTTLMDVLAGRKTGGYIDGNISISGFPKNQETFARISGYCEQNDIHSPQVTVHESLTYSAWLRLGSDVDAETRKLFVEEVMELVELNSLRDSLVGLPGVTGLSTEQRKRLTIAVELVANPSIIFMDEPTSGLDARAAAIVMRTVRNTVDTGRTVVCTIHQPSIDIFEAFDELFLMKRGGQVIYAGPLGRHSHKLVEYFESIDGVAKIKDGYNPATWMLEVSSLAVETRLGVDFADLYRNSDLYQRNKALIRELSTPAPGSKDLYFPSQYSQPFLIQCVACFWKQRWSYWRNPQYTAVRFFFTFICGLMFGTIFWRVGGKKGRQTDLFNAMGSMYTAVLMIGVNNASSVQPLVEIERTVYYREKAAGMYSALPYAFAQAAIELPYVLIQAAIYSVLVYAMMDFQWQAAKFLWYFFFSYFTFLYFTYYGMMTMSLTPNHNISAIVSSAFYAIWNLFAGFLIPRTRIPIWWRWYYWACPVAWTLYGLVASQYGDLENEMELADGSKQMVKEFIKDYFGFHHDFLGAVAGVTIGFCVLFVLVFALGVKYLNFQHR